MTLTFGGFFAFSWLRLASVGFSCLHSLMWCKYASPKSVYLSIYLSISIYFSICLSVHLSLSIYFILIGSCSPFSFCFCFSICLLCREETKQASKQTSKHELLTFGSGVLLGGALRPPQPPPRHEICTSSPTPAPATKSIF